MQQEIMATTENEIICNRLRKIIKLCLFDLDINYLMFILGIVSAVVLEEVYAVLGMVVRENRMAFILHLANVVFQVLICVNFLQYLVVVVDVKGKLEKKPRESRMNYLCAMYEESFASLFVKMEKELKTLFWMAALSVSVYIAEFIFNNLGVLGYR